MRKKVIDIISPSEEKRPFEVKKTANFENNNTGFEKNEPLKELELPKAQKKLSAKNINGRGIKIKILSVLFLFLIGVLAFFFFTFAKATIEIWPKNQTLVIQTTVTADEKKENPDLSFKIIPAIFFDKEKTISKVFPATGKILKENKAEGMVKLYNEYDSSPQVLIATTRFVSSDGKLFRTPVKVTIPGSHYEKGKLFPGEVDVKLVADQPGPDYNIAPSTFSVPGFAGTAKYTKIYAKSSGSMEGGYSGEVSVVTEDDLTKAEDALTKQAKQEAESLLKKEIQKEEISSKYKFLEDSIKTYIVDKSFSATTGSEAKEFNLQIKARIGVLIFKKENFDNFIKDLVNSRIPEGKKIYEPSLKITSSPQTRNEGSGQTIINLDISVKVYSDFNDSILKGAIQGKTQAEVKIFLENQPEIDKVQVKLWPFWVKSVPKNLQNIKLSLKIDP